MSDVRACLFGKPGEKEKRQSEQSRICGVRSCNCRSVFGDLRIVSALVCGNTRDSSFCGTPFRSRFDRFFPLFAPLPEPPVPFSFGNILHITRGFFLHFSAFILFFRRAESCFPSFERGVPSDHLRSVPVRDRGGISRNDRLCASDRFGSRICR